MPETSALPPASRAIADFLGAVEIGAPHSQGGLTVWPLLRRSPADARHGAAPAYELLSEALARGTVRIDEVSREGAVPNVRVENAGDVAVLVLFGEELRGAKQNRIANASFLVPPRREVVIDVSCVEAGRWHGDHGIAFYASESLVSHELRAKLARSVSASRARGGRFTSDQGLVWEEVDKRLERAKVRSPTRAYEEYHRSRASRLEGMRAAAPQPAPRQVGFVAAIAGRIAGAEVLGEERAFAASHARLLDAYAIDAIDRRGEEPAAATASDPAEFLRDVSRAARTASPSLGLGEDVRLDSPAVVGCALVAGALVHLTAAPHPGNAEG